MEFTVGQYVHSRSLNKTVKIIELLESQPTAIVETLRRNEPNHHVPITDLTSLTNPTPTSTQQPLTPRQLAKQQFDQSLFSDHGTTLTCYCGAITRKIPQVYIKSWGTDNTNAALNYVISLCAHCRPQPAPTFNRSTERHYTTRSNN